jgi:hypothetical protein
MHSRALDLGPSFAVLEPPAQLVLVVLHDEHDLARGVAWPPEPVLVVPADRVPASRVPSPSTLTAPTSPKPVDQDLGAGALVQRKALVHPDERSEQRLGMEAEAEVIGSRPPRSRSSGGRRPRRSIGG